MFITTKGLVVREEAYKESDKILTIITEDLGKITVSARGCRKKSSKISAGCQLFYWSEFVLEERKGRFYVKELSIEQEFPALPQDFRRFSLACYFAQIGETLSLEQVPQNDLLRLLLNCLYVLDKRQDLSPEIIKAVFELRAICQSGYEPMVETCWVCHKETPENPQFSLLSGRIHCKSCGGIDFHLSQSTLHALRYIVYADPSKIFSFHLENHKNLAEFTEAYLLAQLDCAFSMLEFYKKNTSDLKI